MHISHGIDHDIVTSHELMLDHFKIGQHPITPLV